MMTDLTALSWQPYMELEEFVREGYLQEANRRFFHPLGLVLHVGRGEDADLAVKGVIDCRKDPAGVVYEPVSRLVSRMRREVAGNLSRLWTRRCRDRLDACGFSIQPVEEL